jgi:hypothetical protein
MKPNPNIVIRIYHFHKTLRFCFLLHVVSQIPNFILLSFTVLISGPCERKENLLH